MKLKGRLGNQLFMYACARTIQYLKGDNDEILLEDYNMYSYKGDKFNNELAFYNLNNVRYIHDDSVWNTMPLLDFNWRFINKYIERM